MNQACLSGLSYPDRIARPQPASQFYIVRKWLATWESYFDDIEEARNWNTPNNLPKTNGVLIRRKHTLHDWQPERPIDPREDSDKNNSGQVLLRRLNVPMDVGIGGQEAERLAKGNVGDDIEGEILRLATEVERPVVGVGGEVFSLDEVDEF